MRNPISRLRTRPSNAFACIEIEGPNTSHALFESFYERHGHRQQRKRPSLQPIENLDDEDSLTSPTRTESVTFDHEGDDDKERKRIQEQIDSCSDYSLIIEDENGSPLRFEGRKLVPRNVVDVVRDDEERDVSNLELSNANERTAITPAIDNLNWNEEKDESRDEEEEEDDDEMKGEEEIEEESSTATAILLPGGEEEAQGPLSSPAFIPSRRASLASIQDTPTHQPLRRRRTGQRRTDEALERREHEEGRGEELSFRGRSPSILPPDSEWGAGDVATPSQHITLVLCGVTAMRRRRANYSANATVNRSNISRRNFSQVVNDSNCLEDSYFLRADFEGETDMDKLLFVLNQKEIGSWSSILPAELIEHASKIGEGTFSEVFESKLDGQSVALKIMPFEDEHENCALIVNGEHLKKPAQCLPEFIITKEVSQLRLPGTFSTPNFIELVCAYVVRGPYPQKLIANWEQWKKKNKKAAENDHPATYSFPESLFIVIVQRLGGRDVDQTKVESEGQALSLLFQLSLSLVAAEHQLEFEHRDLHLGNVLVAPIDKEETVQYQLNGKDLALHSHGVKLSIIDFSFSRLKKGSSRFFLDMEHDDELFNGKGHQGDCYRFMKEHFGGQWSGFHPMSNVYWLHFVAKGILLEERIAKKKRAPAFSLQRRKKLLSVFDGLLACRTIEQFLWREEVSDLMKEYVAQS